MSIYQVISKLLEKSNSRQEIFALLSPLKSREKPQANAAPKSTLTTSRLVEPALSG